jgi:hypothetical protein
MDKLMKTMGKTLQKNTIAAIISQYNETKNDTDFDIEVFLTEDTLELLFEKSCKNIKIKGPKSPPKIGAYKRTNTYVIFCDDHKKKVLVNSHPNATFAQLAQLCSAAWRKMEDDKKETYKKMAADENERRKQAALGTVTPVTPVTPVKKTKATPKAKAAPKKKRKARTTKKKTTKAPVVKSPSQIDPDDILGELDDLVEEN